MAVTDGSNRWEWKVDPEEQTAPNDRPLLPMVVTHLRDKRIHLRDEWVRRITDSRLLTSMSPEEILTEATSMYDSYVEALETGEVDTVRAYAGGLADRLLPRGAESEEVLSAITLLRDVLTRSIIDTYMSDANLLTEILDVYEPWASRIATTVAATFVHQRERAIRQQHEDALRQQQDTMRERQEAMRQQYEDAIRERQALLEQQALRGLSMPVLQMRPQLLLAPVIGALDDWRTRQLSDGLLDAIRSHRAKVAVIDLTGVPQMDVAVAAQLLQAVEAARLLGARAIITGISAQIASSLAAGDVDLSKLNTVGDLQSGINHAEQILGGPWPAVPAHARYTDD
jgi:rsbT co-antagonist protein RsbR